jgi:hypothetical protein
MNKDPNKEKFHFLTINLLKDRHNDLIEWIKIRAQDKEQSMSSFIISLLKKCKDEEDKNG